MVCSFVYIINDIVDINNDRNHPTKKNRPLASGAITVKTAYILLCVTAVFISAGAFFVYKASPFAICFIAVYLIQNALYSLALKNIPILDIVIIVLGFLVRVIYGGFLVDVVISDWLYLTVIAMSFFLALGKRRNELSNTEASNSTRKVLKFYNKNFLDKTMYMCLTLTIAFYSLWTVNSETVARIGSNKLLWTIPLVMIIFMKYCLTIESSDDGDPTEILLSDKVLLVMIFIFAVITFGIIYF